MKVNLRKGGKYATEREWAYDLIANSTNTTASDMADMMVEQFKHPKPTMSHVLSAMVHNGTLKVTGYTVRNGKRTHVLAANRRRPSPVKEVIIPPFPGDVRPVDSPPVTNGSGVSVVVNTVNGPVTLTVEQAKALAEGLGSLFK